MNENLFNECLKQAKQIVQSYRDEANGDPQNYVAAAILAVVGALAGAGVGAYSAVQAGQAQKASADFNAKVASNNASAQAQQAQADAARISDRNRRAVAAQRAEFLKSGGSYSGSADDLLLDSSTQGELDIASRIYTGQIGAGAQSADAALNKFRGSTAMDAAGLSATGTALSGLSTATNYYSRNPTFRNYSSGATD